MSKPKSGDPWAFVAHKNGYWAGVCAANVPSKDLKKFLGDFAAGGFSITTLYSRDEWNALLDAMKMWHEAPEYKAKKTKAVEPRPAKLTPQSDQRGSHDT